MEITDIRIRKIEEEGRLLAYVTITFDDVFVVHNIKIIDGTGGAFIAMPSRQSRSGEYKDIAHPINSEFREKLQHEIMDAYQNCDDAPVENGEE